MVREIRAAILPAQGLVRTFTNWPDIARRLAESKRKRKRKNNALLSKRLRGSAPPFIQNVPPRLQLVFGRYLFHMIDYQQVDRPLPLLQLQAHLLLQRGKDRRTACVRGTRHRTTTARSAVVLRRGGAAPAHPPPHGFLRRNPRETDTCPSPRW